MQFKNTIVEMWKIIAPRKNKTEQHNVNSGKYQNYIVNYFRINPNYLNEDKNIELMLGSK